MQDTAGRIGPGGGSCGRGRVPYRQNTLAITLVQPLVALVQADYYPRVVATAFDWLLGTAHRGRKSQMVACHSTAQHIKLVLLVVGACMYVASVADFNGTAVPHVLQQIL
jgi:hypothetical protein